MPNEICIKAANLYRADRRNEFCAKQFNDVRLGLEALQLSTSAFGGPGMGVMFGAELSQQLIATGWDCWNCGGANERWYPTGIAGWGVRTGGDPIDFELFADWPIGLGNVDDYSYNAAIAVPSPEFTQDMGVTDVTEAQREVRFIAAGNWISEGAISRLPTGTTIEQAHIEVTVNSLQYRKHTVSHNSWWYRGKYSCPPIPNVPAWVSNHAYSESYTPPDPAYDTSGDVMLIAVGMTPAGNLVALGWSESVEITSGVKSVVDITEPVQAFVDHKGSAAYKYLGLYVTAPDLGFGTPDALKALLPKVTETSLLINDDPLDPDYPDWGICLSASNMVEFTYGGVIFSNVFMDFSLPSSQANRRLPQMAEIARYPAMD